MTDQVLLIQKASKEAAVLITSDIHNYLVNAGWPAEAAYSVQVTYDNSGFGFVFEGSGAEKADVLEYGSESERPTAAIRKYFSQSEKPNDLLMKRLESHLGEIV